MLIDTMFARDMYQVYEINDDWFNLEYDTHEKKINRLSNKRHRENQCKLTCNGYAAETDRKRHDNNRREPINDDRQNEEKDGGKTETW